MRRDGRRYQSGPLDVLMVGIVIILLFLFFVGAPFWLGEVRLK